jgi:hypothetical protein
MRTKRDHATAASPPPARIIDAKYDGKSAFSIKESAEILGISDWAANQAVRRGDIPSVKINGRRIIPRFRLESLLLS